MMARCLFLLSTLCAFVFTSCLDDDRHTYVSRLAVGDQIPSFTVTTLSGYTITSGSMCESSDRSIIVFFTTTCPDCHRQLPELERLMHDYAEDCISFICIGRNQDAEVVSRYWSDNGFSIPCAPQSDDALYRQFATGGIPRIYVTDADGIILYVSDPDIFMPYDELTNIISEGR